LFEENPLIPGYPRSLTGSGSRENPVGAIDIKPQKNRVLFGGEDLRPFLFLKERDLENRRFLRDSL